MITEHAPFKSDLPRISRARFADVMTQHHSPWRDKADDLYDLIVENDHDPAVWLAIGVREHGLGSNRDSVLWRNDTRSWTNARTVRAPFLSGWRIIHDAKRGSDYVQYRSVEDSLIDGFYRVTDPTYRYVREGRYSIGQVLGIWTEDPGPYTSAVVEMLNWWDDDDELNPGYRWVPSPCFGYPIGTVGRNGQRIEWLIIHTSEGSFASGVSWLSRWPSADDEGSSAHVIIGKHEGERVELVIESNAAWTAGNRTYNLAGYNIELAGYAARNPPVSPWQIEECARVCARVIRRNPHLLAKPRYGVIAHDDVPDQDHTDPGPHFDWDYLLQRIGHELDTAEPTPPRSLEDIATDAILDGDTGIWISRVFLDHMTAMADGDARRRLALFGKPITSAFIAGDGQLVQWFERACLGYHPENRGTPYQVQGRLIGTELYGLLRTAIDRRIAALNEE